MGEDDGSLAAVAVAEKQSEIRDAGYLGSIAISGLADAKDLYVKSSQEPSSSMFALLAYGVKTVYPKFQVTDMLTERGHTLYQQINQNCGETATIRHLPPAEMLDPGEKTMNSLNNISRETAWARLAQVAQSLGNQCQRRSSCSRNRDCTSDIARMCKQGDRVQWERYSNLDPGSVISDSARDQITWIEARFAGRPAPANCP